MPAMLTHHLFGRTLLARQGSRAPLSREARDAFLLGNQGADPLFYATRTPYLVATRKLGSCMHHEHIEDYLEAWRNILKRHHIKDQMHEALEAYVQGYLAHYCLDRAAHPLIRSFEKAICAAGIKGLNQKDGSFVHSQIEADLDVYMLYVLTGRTLDEYRIPTQVLYSSDAVLSSLDILYRTAAALYPIKVARTVFSQSVKDARLTVRILYSPGGTKRRLVGTMERLVRRHSLLQAVSHSPSAWQDNWYANEDNQVWRDPDTGEARTDSFVELFDTALSTAESSIKLFMAGVPLIEITQGFDFSGAGTPKGQRPCAEKRTRPQDYDALTAGAEQ